MLERKDERVVLCEQALALADACGAQGLVTDLRARLRGAGVTSTVTTGRASTVSPLERRVGRLHVVGRDERAIAQELFLTPHAVRTTVDSLRERFGDGLAAVMDGSARSACHETR